MNLLTKQCFNEPGAYKDKKRRRIYVKGHTDCPLGLVRESLGSRECREGFTRERERERDRSTAFSIDSKVYIQKNIYTQRRTALRECASL